MHTCEQWWQLHCTSQWRRETPLSEHMRCCCIQSGWARRAMNLHQILHWAWTFLHLNYSDDSEGAAMGNWWLATSSRQCACSCIMSGAELFGKTSNHPGDSAPLQPRFIVWLRAFPKTKITFEREEIFDHRWDSGKYDGEADGDWENCVMSQGAYFEGDWGIIVPCTVFLVVCIFFNKCLYFSHTWLDTFWTDLVYINIGNCPPKHYHPGANEH